MEDRPLSNGGSHCLLMKGSEANPIGAVYPPHGGASCFMSRQWQCWRSILHIAIACFMSRQWLPPLLSGLSSTLPHCLLHEQAMANVEDRPLSNGGSHCLLMKSSEAMLEDRSALPHCLLHEGNGYPHC